MSSGMCKNTHIYIKMQKMQKNSLITVVKCRNVFYNILLDIENSFMKKDTSNLQINLRMGY